MSLSPLLVLCAISELQLALAEAATAEQGVVCPGGSHECPSAWHTVLANALSQYSPEELPRSAIVVLPLPSQSAPVCKLGFDLWRTQIENGLRQPLLIAGRLIEEWLSIGGSGRLVLLVARAPERPGFAIHATVVAGLEALCRTIAREYGGRGITAIMVTFDATALSFDPAHSLALAQLAVGLAGAGIGFVSGARIDVPASSIPGEKLPL